MHPNLWHPYTQAKSAPEPLKVKAGKGSWLILEDDRLILDCISSWWVNTHGHAHPKIAAAIAQQAQILEQVIFAGFTHAPAEQLAEQLVARLPEGLVRVFYSDNGSTAIEVALKMAYQAWANQGEPRSTFLAFEGAYHGDTFGAMAVGARSVFSQAFAPLLFEVEYLPYPATHWGDETVAQSEAQSLAILQTKLEQFPDRYAGIILEPLVQGAGGMRMIRPEFLRSLQAIARNARLLTIYDEIMTGFGRTGDWFACTKAQTQPDIICLSKGITGGFLPLAVTVCTKAIYDAFYSDDLTHTLYHGHSYTANPIGCAAALASLALTQENEPIFKTLESAHTQHLLDLAEHKRCENLRVTGTIAAFDIVSDQATGYTNQLGNQIKVRSIELGLLLRPLGNVLYLLPPYCITPDELTIAYQGIRQLLDEL